MGREGKEGEAGRKEVYGSQGKVRRDDSHKWGWEGSGDCGRAAVKKSGVSKSSRHGAKRSGGLWYEKTSVPSHENDRDL